MNGLVVGGKYHVIQLIGEGGMGAVYVALHAKTGRRVALKLIHEHLATSHGSRRRFEREARAAAAIDSLHVVQILDSGEDSASGMPFIVMEYLQGDDLRNLLRRGPMPERLAIAIALQMASGVKQAHEVDVVHRDLKPANVFLAQVEDGRRVVKVLDFGIAKLADGDGATTATADLVGSPAYMSPEQLRTPTDVDARTDVWAIGVVLYEMLSGRTPTAGVEAIGARAYAICHTPAPSLRALAPHVSPELAAIVHRALEIEPATRFASVGELSTALRTLAPAGTEISEEEVAPFLGASVDTPVVVDARRQTGERRRSSTRWLAAGAGGIIIAVGALGQGALRGREMPRVDTMAVATNATSAPPLLASSALAPPPPPAPAAVVVASSATSAKVPVHVPTAIGSTSFKRAPDAKRLPDHDQPRPPVRSTDSRDQF